jgi:hypothetical protein
MVILSILVAIFTERIGYYVPALLIAPALCATGAGLLSTLTPSSHHSEWMGYQVIYGFGLGCGFQISTLPLSKRLATQNLPIGVAMMFCMQQLGGSIFLSVSQYIFSTKLVDRHSGVAGLDAEATVNTGANDLRRVVPASQLSTVVSAYNYSLTLVFTMAAALSSVMILGALFVEWKSIKGKKESESSEETGESRLEEAKNET